MPLIWNGIAALLTLKLEKCRYLGMYMVPWKYYRYLWMDLLLPSWANPLWLKHFTDFIDSCCDLIYAYILNFFIDFKMSIITLPERCNIYIYIRSMSSLALFNWHWRFLLFGYYSLRRTEKATGNSFLFLMMLNLTGWFWRTVSVLPQCNAALNCIDALGLSIHGLTQGGQGMGFCSTSIYSGGMKVYAQCTCTCSGDGQENYIRSTEYIARNWIAIWMFEVCRKWRGRGPGSGWGWWLDYIIVENKDDAPTSSCSNPHKDQHAKTLLL